MKAILLIGPQGSGKGTQAERISQKYAIPHISTGDLFRMHMRQKSELGLTLAKYVQEGLLVPDTMTLEMVKLRLEQSDCQNGFLLDGYPRNLTQAQDLGVLLESMKKPLTNVICLEIARDLVMERLEGRRSCPTCGRVYHLKYNPPKVDGICDDDESTLIQREDDKPDKIAKRLDIYYADTEPIIEYYREFGLVEDVDATLDISEVFAKIQEVLAND